MPLKMIADTEFTKQSGKQGGLPMFSRFGRGTNAESLVFSNHDAVQHIQSSFAQERNVIVKEVSDSDSEDLQQNYNI